MLKQVTGDKGNYLFGAKNGYQRHSWQDTFAAIDVSGSGNTMEIFGFSNTWLSFSGDRNIGHTDNGNTEVSMSGIKNTFTAGNGNNSAHLSSEAVLSKINFGDGDNTITDSGILSKIDSGDGDGVTWLMGVLGNHSFGDGDNTVITGVDSFGYKIKGGDGNNKLTVDGTNHKIVVGDGNVTGVIAGTFNSLKFGDGDYDLTIAGFATKVSGGTGNGYVTMTGYGGVLNTDGTANVTGSQSNDTISLRGDGDETATTYVDAGAGDDIVKGGALSTILGGAGDDTLFGGKASFLSGGAGNDTLEVNGNKVTGGAGADTFFLSEKASNGDYADITDFSVKAGDKLDLSGIAIDPKTDLGVTISGDTLWLSYKSGGENIQIGIGGVGNGINKVGGFSAAMAAGTVEGVNTNVVSLPVPYGEKG